MKPSLNAIIVGAGGVASYMLQALNNSFDLTGLLIDGDKLEEHNLDRQIFSPRQIGQFKADALVKHHKFRLESFNEYLDEDFLERVPQEGRDIVICLVDNHPARRAALKVAKSLNIPIIICANEYVCSQVMYWHPDFGLQCSPEERYPEIATSNEGSPIRCQGAALESTPQLAIANEVSGALGNFLIWLWHGTDGYLEAEEKHFAPVEINTTFSKVSTITLEEIQQS